MLAVRRGRRRGAATGRRWLAGRIGDEAANDRSAVAAGGQGRARSATIRPTHVHVPVRAGRNVVDGVSSTSRRRDYRRATGLTVRPDEPLEAVLGVHADATAGEVRTWSRAAAVAPGQATGWPRRRWCRRDRKPSGFCGTMSVEQNMTLSKSRGVVVRRRYLRRPGTDRLAGFIDQLRIKASKFPPRRWTARAAETSRKS